MNIAHDNVWTRLRPSRARLILEAMWSQSVLAPGPARLATSFAGSLEADRSRSHLQPGRGSPVRQQPAREEG